MGSCMIGLTITTTTVVVVVVIGAILTYRNTLQCIIFFLSASFVTKVAIFSNYMYLDPPAVPNTEVSTKDNQLGKNTTVLHRGKLMSIINILST